MSVFIGQAADITLTAKDRHGIVMNLTGRTVHLLTRDPSGNVSTDTTPTITTPTNGRVQKSYAAGDLDEVGDWMAKLLIDGDEIPSTRYVFHVFGVWDA